MADRFVTVGDDLTLPTSVKVADGNLPAAARAAALDAKFALKSEAGGAALTARLGALGKFRAALAGRATTPVNVVTVGSSTTAGNNATAPEYRYVNRLAAMIQAEYPSGLGTETTPTTIEAGYNAQYTAPGVHFYNGGIPGERSAGYLSPELATKIGAISPALVLHMVGANDMSGSIDPNVYKTNMEAALARVDAAVGVDPVHVLVHQFQRWDVAGAYPWTQYRDKMKAIADANPGRVVFIDLNPAYVALGIPGVDKLNLIDTDNIHQNNDGHALMADLLRKEFGLSAPFDLATSHLSILDGMRREALAAPFVETFTRADGATLGTSDSGQAWAVESGAFAITGNKATITTAGNAFVDTGKSNIDLTVKLTHPGTAGFTPGIMFRAIDAANRLGVFIEPTAGVRLYMTKAGANTITNGTGSIYYEPITYTIRIVAVGGTITVYLDGVLSLTHTLSAGDAAMFASATKIGLRSGAVTPGITWDDIRVDAA